MPIKVYAANSYYVSGDKCIFSSTVPAFELAERIAYGEPVARQYEQLLYGEEFNYRDDVIEPLHLAYGLYLIAERIGDTRGKARMKWAEHYIHPQYKDRVMSAIYRKYSLAYLKGCFSINSKTVNEIKKAPSASKGRNYDLYMHGGD